MNQRCPNNTSTKKCVERRNRLGSPIGKRSIKKIMYSGQYQFVTISAAYPLLVVLTINVSVVYSAYIIASLQTWSRVMVVVNRQRWRTSDSGGPSWTGHTGLGWCPLGGGQRPCLAASSMVLWHSLEWLVEANPMANSVVRLHTSLSPLSRAYKSYMTY